MNAMKISGIVLIVLGLAGFFTGGFSFTQETTKAQIGNRREATAMATASSAVKRANKLLAELGRNAAFATIIAVENASGDKLGKQAFRPLRAYCNNYHLAPVEVADPRYGSVKAWPAAAWLEVYGINLGNLFGGAQ